MERVAKVRAVLLAAAIGLGIAACESTTGPGDAASVEVAFRTAGPGGAALRAPGGAGRLATSAQAAALEIQGSNGTLSLGEIWFIVSEFELEQVESACLEDDVEDDDEEDDDEEDDDDEGEDAREHECEEFEAPPSFVQLPLDGTEEPAVTRTVAPGVYREVEFEIEDIEVDEGEDAGEVATLFAEIRSRFPDWPEEASMLVAGTFTPTGGAPVPFTVFFEAEIEIEREFDPPLDLTAGDEATVTIVVDPAAFFLRPDGTVLDLAQLDGQLVEFEFEMEHGFSGVESERHGEDADDDDDDDGGDDG